MLLPRYAAGTLGSEQVDAVQVHLGTGCASCLDALYGLPVGKPRDVPPAPTAASAANPVAAGPALSARRSGPPLWLTLLAVVVLTVGAMVWRYRVGAERNRLATRLAGVEMARTAAAEMIEELAGAPGGLQSILLSAATAAPAGHGLVLWNPTRAGVLLVLGGLPAGAPESGFTARLTVASGMSGGHRFVASSRGDATVALRLQDAVGRLQAVEILDDASGKPALVSRPAADTVGAGQRPSTWARREPPGPPDRASAPGR